jgi:dihydrofolate reductase
MTTEPTFTIIAAVSLDGKIGHDDKLLWHIPEDLKHFKENTIHQVLLMGLNTFKFLPAAAKKNHKFIILNGSEEELSHESILFQCKSISELFEELKFDQYQDIRNIFVAGGAMVYESMLPFCNKALITIVEESYPNANKKFPAREFLYVFKCTTENAVYMRSTANIVYSFLEYSRVL